MQWRSRLPLRRLAVALSLLLLAPELRGQTSAADPGAALSTQPRALREREVAAESPTLSFIDCPNATCYREETLSSLCYVEWSYLFVTATSSQYLIEMTVEIGGRLRATFGGFFQSYMYVPADMYAQALIVACGPRGGGGDPNRGNVYSYAVRAKETGGLTAASYGSVVCPFAIPLFSDGFESGATLFWSARRP